MTLRTQVINSLKWLAGARIIGQAATWAITLVVIRLLDPDDYGLMATADIFIGFTMLFREIGFSTAIVQNPNLTKRQVEETFGMLLLINFSIFALILAVAPLIAVFFDDPRLTDIIRVLAFQFPLVAIGVVQNAMLSRRMAFRGKSIVNLIAVLTNGMLTLLLALRGLGVWALVWGSLAGSVTRAIGLLIVGRQWYNPRFRFTQIGGMARFGGFVTATRLLWYSYQQSDKLIVGKFLGQDVLGQYAVAMQVASMPLQKFSAMMNKVGLAAYSQVQDDASAVRFYFLKAVRSVAFFAFPVFWGISSVAAPLVDVVLGEQWTPAIVPLAVLGLVMPARMVASAGNAAYDAVGKPQIVTVNIFITCLVMPPAFLFGVQWGLLGVSLVWLIAFPLVTLIRWWRSLPALGLTIGQYLRAMAPAATGAGIMYASVSIVRLAIADSSIPEPAALAMLIAVGAITYAGFMWLMHRDQCLQVLRLVQGRAAVPG